VVCLAFSPDGVTLASAADDNTIRLWEMVTGQERAILPISAIEGGMSLAFSPNGRELRLLAPKLNRIIRWSADSPNASP
jgi:WD40 repeat protein